MTLADEETNPRKIDIVKKVKFLENFPILPQNVREVTNTLHGGSAGRGGRSCQDQAAAQQ